MALITPPKYVRQVLTTLQARGHLAYLVGGCVRDRIIAAGMASWIGLQSYINIGVATGLLPNTGIPLPFVSYGLTSLLCLYCGLGLVQSIYLKNDLKTASEHRVN